MPDKAYWRSLSDRPDGPMEPTSAVPATVSADEFPEGASATPEGMSRRAMLGLMGATVALGGAVGCRRPVETIVPYVNAPEGRIPGIAEFYASTFKQGGHAYGVLVESHGGRPTKIEGNALHPSSGGSASSWMLASTLHLYDPDRSQRPQRRGAEDGEPEDATWEDFAAFWELNRSEGAADGADLAVLAGVDPSPTRDRLAEAFRQRYPAARWVVWEPIHEGRVIAGVEATTGQALRPVHHLDEAEVIVTLGADPLLTGGEAVRHGRGWSTGRRRGVDGGTMNRLYAVESTLTVTGAAADHRIPLRFDQLPAFASALAAALGAGAASGSDALPAAARSQIETIAADLRAAGSAAVVMAAPELAPEVHGTVLAINGALGAIGRTVTLHPAGPDDAVTEESLTDLVTAMADGSVQTLVTLGTNPVFDAPADLAFGEAMDQVAQTIHVGLYRDETGERSTWHLPEAHFLEAWGDARTADGTLSIVQPLIAPLWDSRGTVEVLAMMTGESETGGYELVRKTWGDTPFGIDEKTWRKALHDGVAEGSAEPAVSAAASAAASAPGGSPANASADDLELTFHPAGDLWDGRYANLSWLQELPDPITKITWDNAALFSPATAERLGVSSGDRVRLTYRERSLEAPAWVMPGQAENSVALSLGYGRSHVGRVGNEVGVNGYALRTSDAPGGGGGLTVEVLGGEYALSQTQEHWSLEGRPLVREGTLEQFRAEPAFAQAPEAKLHLGSLWEEPTYDTGPQWGMAIDLNACTGCSACVIACQSENNIPVVGKEQVANGREMHWLRIDRYFAGDPAAPEVVFQPVPCQHCENAPCEQVCPVAATVHDREGINAMVYNRCIGTRYCSNNCPYKVRRFNFFNYTKDTPELLKIAMNPDVTVRSRGVMEKCTYCIQRINQAKIEVKRAERQLADGDVKTACQQACPADAIEFGDITDEASRVKVAKGEPRNYVMLAELNNQPRTSYLAKVRNPNPNWKSLQDGGA